MIAKTVISLAALTMLMGHPVAAVEHHHLEDRALVTQYVYQTIIVDQNGNAITEAATGESFPVNPTPSTTSGTYTSSAPTVAPAVTSSESSSSAPPRETSIDVPASTSASPETSSSSNSWPNPNAGIFGDLSNNQQPEAFKDGVISCSDFPSGNGVIALEWMGLGGWSGIQYNHNGATSTGYACDEGAFCSYACQPGMSKSQWPSDQPANGVSIGGLHCRNGKLYRTNPAESSLCVWGAGSALVKSELSQDVAICRTDYPGTENMVIPTLAKAGSEVPLTVVESESYYTWRNGLTSAQYYVNNAGVSVEEGCLWSASGSRKGNWAPLNFGAGRSGSISWLALIPNPNNREPANFNVKIVSANGGSLNGNCVYENGKFNGGDDGCTAAVTNGEAYFVLYN